jgi:4-diphosphocytidyl-2-C-methyl-D-erythritol kinase
MVSDAGTVTDCVSVSAPAKLTLSLRVAGVRPDGYHELEAEMVTIDLVDTLTFEPGHGLVMVDEVVGGLGIGDMPSVAENLVARALALVDRRAAVRVVKRIPLGAGLGGGSADAAAVLRWSGHTDAALSMRLGSDVPFCVVGGRARVGATGDAVEVLPHEDRSFVLLVPPLASSTAAVYRAWDERHDRDRARDPSSDDFGNDLEAAAIEVTPALVAWRDALEGITGCRPRLAGSGSTWFVEGDAKDLGVEGRRSVEIDGARAALMAVRTVPAGA